MREPIRDTGRLEHILEAIRNVESFTEGLTKEALEKDVLHLHAVTYNIQVIGEAVYKLSTEFKASHPSVQWSLIEKMRHILVHDYYRIDPDILWDIIQKDLPVLKEHIETMI